VRGQALGYPTVVHVEITGASPAAEAQGDAPARQDRDQAPRPPQPRWWDRWWLDALLLAPALVLAWFAELPRDMLSRPFWLDEGWVADSLRAPVGQLKLLASSTPVGWELLLRLVPHVGLPERLRLVPMLFAVATAAAGWLFGRQFGRVQGVAVGLAVAAAPGMLMMRSLKQYTAEAFVALLLVWLASRVEARWRPQRVIALGVACVAAIFLSNTTVFVSAALFGALGLLALWRRDWRRLAWVAAVAAGALAVEAVVYLAFVGGGNNAGMQRYWGQFFVPVSSGPGASLRFIGTQGHLLLGRIGFGPALLSAALVIAGLVILWRAGRPAVATAVVLLAAGQLLASIARRYPLFDVRTSMFYAVLLTACAALPIGWFAAWTWRRLVTAPLGVVAVGLAAALLVPAAHTAQRSRLPPSRLRQQVDEVLAHRRPGDVVVVGWVASFPFAYYWPDEPSFAPTDVNTAVRFKITYPNAPGVVASHQNYSEPADERALRTAIARIHASGDTGRIWLVLADSGDGITEWPAAIKATGLHVVSHTRPLLLTVNTG
jgi:hypothetical protein